MNIMLFLQQKLKSLLFFLVFTLSFTANAQQLIGVLKMITNKPIRFHENYELLKKNKGLSSDVYDNNRGVSIQEAVNKVISTCRCGEFLMNVEIYSYENSYIVIGDIWGVKRNTCLYKVGDKVSWGKRNIGEIISIIDDNECVVKDLRTNRQKEIDFDDLYFAKNQTSKFQVGDKVSWKTLGGVYKTGVIVSIKNEYGCLVKELDTGKQKEMRNEDLFLINE